MKTFKIYIQYFYLCFLLGAFCFGGGYGMIPVMEREFVKKRNFVTKEEMTDIVALSQSLPGLISINITILTGYRRKGVLCAFFGVLGLILPSVIVLSLIALVYTNIIDNHYVQAAFKGVRAGVIALLISAVIKLFKSSVKDVFTLLLASISAVAFALAELLNLSWLNPVYVIILGGLAGLIKGLMRRGEAAPNTRQKSGKSEDGE